ncbi:MAG: hypothetical protein K6G89_03170 [Clostridia bacterium]|nr:hypothetical protein [Clostridia bacterium]
MESIYEIISSALGDGTKLPADFNILRIVQGDAYPPPADGTDRTFTDDGVREGEFDAVITRIPARFTQHLVVNMYAAIVLKKGVGAYDKIKKDETDEKKINACNKKIESAKAVIEKYEPITIADKVLSQMVSIKTPKDQIAEFGRYLAKEGKTINQVKLGIAMTGFFGTPEDKDTVILLGRCGEFAFFASKALSTLLKDENEFVDACMEIVRANDGWGKISALIDLPDKIGNGEHKRWLIAHGNECSLGLYHLAVECAVKGDLGGLLLGCVNDKTHIDQELANGICNIIEGLFQAENVSGADSFSEINDVGTMLSSFAYCVRAGYLTGDDRAQVLVDKLVESKYIRKA